MASRYIPDKPSIRFARACFCCFSFGVFYYEQLRPKFSIRVNPDTPHGLLRFAAECIQEGKNAMVFANEPLVRKAMLRRGKDPADLANFIPIGCYEPAIMGKELSCTMQCVFNLSKPVEDLFADGAAAPATWKEAETRYFTALERNLRDALATARRWEEAWRDINPSPMLSATMAECMQRDPAKYRNLQVRL